MLLINSGYNDPSKSTSWYLFGCSTSKSPEQELLQYLLGLAKKYDRRLCCFRIELMPLRGEKNSSNSHMQNLGTSYKFFSNFRRMPLPLRKGVTSGADQKLS